jgi:hypothetical protein
MYPYLRGDFGQEAFYSDSFSKVVQQKVIETAPEIRNSNTV